MSGNAIKKKQGIRYDKGHFPETAVGAGKGLWGVGIEYTYLEVGIVCLMIRNIDV